MGGRLSFKVSPFVSGIKILNISHDGTEDLKKKKNLNINFESTINSVKMPKESLGNI